MTQPIEPGDVLLFRGNSFISRAIRFFDGSLVNHAAIATSQSELAEASGKGLRVFQISEAESSNERMYARRLKDESPLEPVVRLARDYVERGVPYAYQQIILLALLALTRRVSFSDPWLRRAVRLTLDRAAQLVNGLFDSGRKLMICSEFVFRCFDEALPEQYDAYSLDILGFKSGTGRLLSSSNLPESDRIQPGALAERLPSFEPTPEALSVTSPLGEPDVAVTLAEAELESLFAKVATLQVGSPTENIRSVAPSDAGMVSDDELMQSAFRFSMAMAANADAAQPAISDPNQLTPLRVEGILNTVADFVTPGDLLRCPSLFDPFGS